MKTNTICSAVLCLLVAACNGTQQNLPELDIQRSGDTLSLASGSVINKEITTETVQMKTAAGTFSTVGTVRAATGKLASVGVPFDGRTTKSYVRLGQRVRAGQALFGFISKEIAEMTTACFQAKSRSELAARNLDRKIALHGEGVVSDRELEEARSEAEIASDEYVQSQNSLKMFGVDVAGLMKDRNMSIVSPIDGEVVSSEFVEGQFVKADSDPQMVVADLSTVWVEAQVKEAFIGSIDEEGSVDISFGTGNTVKGRILYSGKILDELTRSILVTIECSNREAFLKPGMFVNVSFIREQVDQLVIPSSAVLQGQDAPFVYVKLSDGRFVRRDVAVSTLDSDEVMVHAGLEAGDVIVTKGGIFLSR